MPLVLRFIHSHGWVDLTQGGLACSWEGSYSKAAELHHIEAYLMNVLWPQYSTRQLTVSRSAEQNSLGCSGTDQWKVKGGFSYLRILWLRFQCFYKQHCNEKSTKQYHPSMAVIKDTGLFTLDQTLWLLMLSCSSKFSTLPRFPFSLSQSPKWLICAVCSFCRLTAQSEQFASEYWISSSQSRFVLGLWKVINVLKLLATPFLHHH